ncbi:MAG: hypothetical protein N2508_03010 [Anaerolineae bacterium]|nr:hypothetical protein [Anaerolineae bacterium]
MSKSRKEKKPEHTLSSFSPLALLRPRLDGLLGNEALARKEEKALRADLNAVFKGLKAADFLPVFLSACQTAPSTVQKRLDEVVPVWLKVQSHLPALLELVQKHRLSGMELERALAWLKAAGINIAYVEKTREPSAFYTAYMYADKSQGIILLFWYSDRKHTKVQGMGFLVDYNPPWEGSIKDIVVYPQRTPEQARREFVNFWAEQYPLNTLSPAEAKLEILSCLECNRREGIRLPRDLVRAKDLFFKHILTLPDTPDTPGFTPEDFALLSRSGQSAEAIMEFEQTVGRRVRLDDGKEILVMSPPDDWADEW